MRVNILDVRKLLEKEKKGILLTEEIIGNVDNITKDIQSYTHNDDIVMLKKLKRLCLVKALTKETAEMIRNIGMYHFYKNDTKKATRYISQSLRITMEQKSYNLIVQFLADKGLVSFYDLKYKSAQKAFKQALELLPYTDGLEDKTQYLLYLRTGILYWHMEDYINSYNVLCEALIYAKEIPQQGKVLLNIGANYERRELYNEALEYFNKALKLYGEDYSIERSSIHNSIAELYKNIGNYEKALEHINEAFVLLESKNMSKFFIFFMTYTQIKILQGESKDELNRLVELISQVNEIFMYKCFIVDGINIAVKADLEDKQIMAQYAKQITDIMDKIGKGSKTCKGELNNILSDMCLSLKVLSSN
ncbi:MAG TPA: tetratricopeptide repeat protein [Clostridia bacterium]|nr:tetratricopeptide repeat protein [Clostridia bacterium]